MLSNSSGIANKNAQWRARNGAKPNADASHGVQMSAASSESSAAIAASRKWLAAKAH
jgi:hypothetical protein